MSHTMTTPGDATPVAVCTRSGWRSQFGRPEGLGGRLAGRLMAVKNVAMNRLAAERLEIAPDDRILEIGFGPGTLIRMIAERAPRGFTAGIDPSEVMVAQATARNRAAVEAGRVRLALGTASSIPFEDHRFTKACAVNSFHHWNSPVGDLREVRRVLRPEGTLLLCLRVALPRRSPFAAPGLTEEDFERTEELVREAGFSGLRRERRRAGREVECLYATA
jgi:SAM-dependent methyltransferase